MDDSDPRRQHHGVAGAPVGDRAPAEGWLAGTKRQRQSGAAVALLLGTGVVLLVGLGSRVSYADSDPLATLLVARQIVLAGTIRLDALVDGGRLDPGHWAIYRRDGHHYDYFPLGTALAATPVVFLEHLFGADVAERPVNAATQRGIASSLAAAVFLLSFLLARRLLAVLPSLVVSLVFSLGTSYASTVATALWSHDLAVVLILTALRLLLGWRPRRVAENLPASVLLGAILFAAYLTRPTTVLFAAAVACYLWRLDRRSLLPVAGIWALLFAAFAAFSLGELGTVVPPYYQVARLGNGGAGGDLLAGFLCNTVSPSRGLLVSSPFLLLTLLGLPVRWSAWPHRYLSACLLGWIAGHLLLVSAFESWWGGGCFGPRLMTDVLPALFLLTVFFFATLRGGRGATVGWTLAFLLLGGWAVFVHTVQGLYEPWTKRWNAEPNVNDRPRLVFDWRYPQFLHDVLRDTERRLAERLADAAAVPLHPGRQYGPQGTSVNGGPAVAFLGWSATGGGRRWILLRGASLGFHFAGAPDRSYRLVTRLYAGSPCLLALALNRRGLGRRQLVPGSQDVATTVDAGLLRSGRVNVLTFWLPAPCPGRDERRSAVAFRSLALEPAGDR